LIHVARFSVIKTPTNVSVEAESRMLRGLGKSIRHVDPPVLTTLARVAKEAKV
jgi:hypothetical protein